jgi:DNA gyrase subunit A
VRKFDEIGLHDTIVKEDVVLTINQRSEAKITRLSDYRQTGRRSAGVKETKDEENAEEAAPKFAIKVTTHDLILLFTDKGKCHELPAVQLPITARRGKPLPLKSLFVDLQDDEQAVAVLALDTEKTFPEDDSFVLLASDGGIKRLSVESLMKHRGNSCVCVPAEEGVKLVGADYVKANDYVAIFMARGLIRCFGAESIRQTKSRGCGTVKTKPADEGDRFVRLEALSPNSKSDVLVVTSDGFAVRVPMESIPVKKGRGAGGNKLIRLDREDCELVYAGAVQDGDLVFLTTSALKSAVFDVTEVRETAARGGKGVRVGRLEGAEKIVAAAVVRPMERT